jgi:lysophospholipase L1-like esterase
MVKIRKHFFSIIKNIWLVLGILLLLSIFLCLISSFYLHQNTSDYKRVGGYPDKDKKWAKGYFIESEQIQSEWNSYNYWRCRPIGGKYINIDQNGIRHTTGNIVSENSGDHGPLKIFMFGGSALWGLGARDDYTIPSYVAKICADRGLSVQVTNFGQLGYVSTQEVIELFLQLRNNNIPDLVVFYDGVNDCYTMLQGSQPGSPKNEYNRVAEFNLLLRPFDIPRELLIRSDVFKVARKISKNSFNIKPRGPVNVYNHREIGQKAVDIYLNNIRLVSSMLKSISNKSILSLYYWQPTIYFKKHLTLYEEQEYSSSKANEDIFTAADERIKEKRLIYEDCNFYNIQNIFMAQKEPIFIDMCHLNADGNKIVANRMVDDILMFSKQRSLK